MREADMQCPLPLQKVTQLEGLMAATPREREAEQPVDERLQKRTRALAGIKTRITSIESQFATAVERFDEVFDVFVKRTDLLREALAKEEASQQKEEGEIADLKRQVLAEASAGEVAVAPVQLPPPALPQLPADITALVHRCAVALESNGGVGGPAAEEAQKHANAFRDQAALADDFLRVLFGAMAVVHTQASPPATATLAAVSTGTEPAGAEEVPGLVDPSAQAAPLALEAPPADGQPGGSAGNAADTAGDEGMDQADGGKRAAPNGDDEERDRSPRPVRKPSDAALIRHSREDFLAERRRVPDGKDEEEL